MIGEMDTAFELLRAALTGEVPTVGAMDASQWWSLFRLMQKNHVAALTADAAGMLPEETRPSRDVLMPWLAEKEKIASRSRYQRDVLRDIATRMKSHGIKTLVLKGVVLSEYYPTPELREFGDLDLYFYDKHDEADEVARREMGVGISNDRNHHTKYDYRGVTVESHYHLLNDKYPPSNRQYETLLQEQLGHPTFAILFLLRHMAVHFASGRLTLRDLADWALACQAMREKVDWSCVESAAKRFGMTRFVSAMNSIAERRLGFHGPLTLETIAGDGERIERDILYGDTDLADHPDENLGRLGWKLKRWRAMAWKREMVFNDSSLRLLIASLGSHAASPRSVIHKM
jgi:hypothetical protein